MQKFIRTTAAPMMALAADMFNANVAP